MSSSKRLKVLWLCSWYPSKVDSFNGDFIQRHAESVSIFNDVYVIHVVKSKHRIKSTFSEVSVKEGGRLVEELIYYPNRKGVLAKLLSQIELAYNFIFAVLRYTKRYGKPCFFHFHIAYPIGFTAWILRRLYNIPQLLGEHWTGYFPESDFNVKDLNIFQRLFLNRLLMNVIGLHAVSKCLLNFIESPSENKRSVIIANSVDSAMFFQSSISKKNTFSFVHISNMSIQKHPEDILSAARILLAKGYDFRILMIGDYTGKVAKMVQQMELSHAIDTMGEIPHLEVAAELRKSNAMVHAAHYETFGCVLIEAFASGVPVVAYDLPVFKELIIPGKNGLVAKEMTPESLADAMEEMMNSIDQYDADQIRSDALAKYSMPVVASQFDSWYRSCISPIPLVSNCQ